MAEQADPIHHPRQFVPRRLPHPVEPPSPRQDVRDQVGQLNAGRELAVHEKRLGNDLRGARAPLPGRLESSGSSAPPAGGSARAPARRTPPAPAPRDRCLRESRSTARRGTRNPFAETPSPTGAAHPRGSRWRMRGSESGRRSPAPPLRRRAWPAPAPSAAAGPRRRRWPGTPRLARAAPPDPSAASGQPGERSLPSAAAWLSALRDPPCTARQSAAARRRAAPGSGSTDPGPGPRRPRAPRTETRAGPARFHR